MTTKIIQNEVMDIKYEIIQALSYSMVNRTYVMNFIYNKRILYQSECRIQRCFN